MPFGQLGEWVDGFAIAADFEVQNSLATAVCSHSGNLLTAPDTIAFFHKKFVVVRISTEVSIVVFDDNKLSIADKSTPAVNHLPRCSCLDVLAIASANLDAFLSRGRIRVYQLTIRRP